MNFRVLRPGRVTPGRARRSSNRRDHRLGFLLTLPWIMGLLMFSLVPIVMTARWSFMKVRLFGDSDWVGLDNYARMAADPKLHKALFNTLIFMGVGLPLTILLSFGLALILRELGTKGLAFRAMAYLPVVVPVVAAGYLWKWIYEPESGTMNTVLSWLGINGPGWLVDPVWSRVALLIFILWGCGGTVLIYLATLVDVSKDLHEAAKLDGANWWQRVRHVDWPATRRVTLFQVIMGLIAYFQLYGQPFLLAQQKFQPTAAGPENSLLTLSIYIYQQGFVYLDFGYASAVAWILFAMTLVASLVALRLGDGPES